MKLDFKSATYPMSLYSYICLSLSVHLSIWSYFLRNEMRNLSSHFVFSCGSSALRLFVAADPHPAHYTCPQLSPPIHLSSLLVRGPGVPFITSSSITGGLSQLYLTKHPRCLPTLAGWTHSPSSHVPPPSCQRCPADIVSVWWHQLFRAALLGVHD